MPMFGSGGLRLLRNQLRNMFTSSAGQQIVIVSLLGQSNMPGRNAQDGLDTLPTNAFQYGGNATDTATYQKLTPVAVPLQFTEGSDGYRVGPGFPILNQIRIDNPAAVIIVVPVAVGSTAMVGGASPRWAPGNPGGDLFEAAISQTSGARTAALSAYPGATIRHEVIVSQGEQDASLSMSASAWTSTFASFVSLFRSRVPGATTARFTIGSMLPQKWVVGDANYLAAYAAINYGQVQASLTIPGVSYVKGPTPFVSENLHYQPAANARQYGAFIGASLSDVTGPTMTSPASMGSTSGRALAMLLAADDTHQTFHIDGGADAGLFEISDPYLTPTLRWSGNGTGPATNGVRQVGVRARDGSGNYGPTRLTTVPVAAVGGVSPASFFTSGERGMVWDLTDSSTLFQDVAGTVPVTAAGQSVGRVLDKSPNANHWIAAADNTTRPTYQIDSDGKPYLAFDGSNDVLLAATPYHTASNVAVTAAMGIFGGAQSATKTVLATNSTSTGNPFVVPFQTNGASADLRIQLRSDGASALSPVATVTGALDSTKRVLTAFEAGGNQLNGMRSAAGRTAGGGTKAAGGYNLATAGSTAAPPITSTRAGLGANAGATPANFFAGRVYSGFAINRVLTDAEIANGEDWIAARTLTTALP